jgi:hypothetical protein
MVPTKGPTLLTEDEYWRDYDIIRNDVTAAMVCCYTQRAINDIAVADPAILQKLNRNANFWRINSFSLQGMLFIVLARILDTNPDVHSVYQLLRATTAHPEFFTKDALRARKLAVPGGKWDIKMLDSYVERAWLPTMDDLRQLRKALAPHKSKFDDIYKPIRNQIAHIILKEQALVEDLYARTQKTEIDDILRFLHSLVWAIREMADNGRPPNLCDDNYHFADRVSEIKTETERLLRQFT